jgi:hypothetical protein
MDSQEADKTKWEESLERMNHEIVSLGLGEDEGRHTIAVIIPHGPYSVFLSC